MREQLHIQLLPRIPQRVLSLNSAQEKLILIVSPPHLHQKQTVLAFMAQHLISKMVFPSLHFILILFTTVV